MTPAALRVNSIQGLTGYVASKQIDLDAQGANIGSVVVNVKHAKDGTPLLAYAGDETWGQSFYWLHPLAQSYVDDPWKGAQDDLVTSVADTGKYVAGDPAGAVKALAGLNADGG